MRIAARPIPLALSALLASAAATAPAASLPKGDRLLVIVNRDSIRSADLDRQIIAIHTGLSNDKKADFDYEKVLNKLVNDRLIIQEALAMGMDKEADMVRQLGELRQKLAVAQYLKDHYRPKVKVGQAEIDKAFGHYYRKMRIRSLARPTREETGKLIDSIRAGASMDTLARALSLDSRKVAGGLHPLSHYADIELALRVEMDKLKKGEISAPFPYRKVYACIRLEDSLPPDPKEIPAYRKNLELMLLDEKQQAAWEKFLKGIYADYRPVLNQANYDRIAKDSANVLSAAFMKGDTATVISFQGGERVTDDDFRKRISHYVMGEGLRNFGGIMEKTRKSMTAELALNAVAEDQGYLKDPAVARAYKRSLDSSLIEAYLAEMVVKKIKFNRQEFDDYHMSHLEDFRLPDEFIFSEMHLSHKDTAEQVVARLKQGTDFKYLAKQHPSQEKLVARDAEWVTLDILPEPVRKKLDKLKIGQSSDPIATDSGWTILHVDNRRKGGFIPLEDSELKIRQVMFQKKFSAYLDTVLATLKANASITYRQDEIRNYFGRKN